MESARNLSLLNMAAGLLIGASVSLWATLFIIGEVWARAAPTATAQALYRHKGITCIGYFTAFQATAHALMLLAPLLFGLGLIIAPKKNIRTRPLSFTFDADDPGKFRGRSQLVGMIGALVVIFTVGPAIVRFLLSAGLFFNLG
jgi:hypothetical protein